MSGNLLSFGTVTATNILTLCLVVVTALYCLLTYLILRANSQMVAQMRAQYESFISPVIATTIHIKHSVFVYLKIRNKGQSAAKNLRLSFDRDFYQAAEFTEERNVRKYAMFNRNIPSFGPDEELFILLSQGFNLGKSVENKEITPHQFIIGASYEFGGKRFSSSHEVDLSAYMNTSQDRSELLEELENIRKALEKK